MKQAYVTRLNTAVSSVLRVLYFSDSSALFKGLHVSGTLKSVIGAGVALGTAPDVLFQQKTPNNDSRASTLINSTPRPRSTRYNNINLVISVFLCSHAIEYLALGLILVLKHRLAIVSQHFRPKFL